MSFNPTEANGDSENMVSNLPLLFAGGYPTTLDRITATQLEKFIPFLVQCSLGNIQIQPNAEYNEPEWWPDTAPFTIPMRRPPYMDQAEWHATMKQIVTICYSFHKGIFLLRFCNDLCAFPPEHLRFIDNQNCTTSLHERGTNRLLVTFRNENMLYDAVRPINSKKTLLPRLQNPLTSHHDHDEGDQESEMAESSLFDIYLCDNCEAELYSKEAYEDHEKHCITDDDVICCDPVEEPSDTILQQSIFLSQFGLQTDRVTLPAPSASSKSPTKCPKDPPGKQRRMPKRGRPMVIVGRYPTIPLTSPAGQQLLKISNATATRDYIGERLERCERFCAAPCIGPTSLNRPKILDRKSSANHISTNFRRPPLYYYREYTFPRRQFSRKRRDEAFLHFNYHFLRKCYPLSVQLKKMSPDNIQSVSATHRKELTPQEPMRHGKRRRKSQHTSPAQDVIDLCSSEDEQQTIRTHSWNVVQPSTSQQFYTSHLSQTCDTPVSYRRQSTTTTSLIQETEHISIHRVSSVSQITTEPCTSTQSSFHSFTDCPTSPNSSVLIFSHLTKTSMSLANHKKTYNYIDDQENSHHSYMNGHSPGSAAATCSPMEVALPNSVTLTAASHHNHSDSNRCVPDVVIERILQPNQQMFIDLT